MDEVPNDVDELVLDCGRGVGGISWCCKSCLSVFILNSTRALKLRWVTCESISLSLFGTVRTSEENVLSAHSNTLDGNSVSQGSIYPVVDWILLSTHHPQEVFSLGHCLLVGGLSVMGLQLFQGLLVTRTLLTRTPTSTPPGPWHIEPSISLDTVL